MVGGAMASKLAQATQKRPPNIVLIFIDDMGWGDLSCYGQTQYQTPILDRMAAEGTRFTDFLVASPGCSPSRAAILTGCYPQRVSVPEVLNPDSPTGLSLDEQTLAELLKARGYATGMIGKWHLGVNNLMPRAQGFDEYFGLPYSNDMWPPNGKRWPTLHLFQNEKVVDTISTLADQDRLTRRYTEKAVDFIHRHKNHPFFLYLPHSMVHVPLGVSSSFRGKSRVNLYADTVMEVDWAVGEVLRALKRNGLDDDTLVWFTADNGPWLPYGDHAGSAGPFREGKGTTFEGGFREPCIVRWPGHVPAGRVEDKFLTALDVVPTLCHVTGATLPAKQIDGVNAWDLVSGKPEATAAHDVFYYYYPGELRALRWQNWKLQLPHTDRHQAGLPGRGGKWAGEVNIPVPMALYNLANDPGEKMDVSARYPAIVAKLQKLADEARADLGDSIKKIKGHGVRAPGRVEKGSR